MQPIHPYRYADGFRGQLQRIDRLYGDLTQPHSKRGDKNAILIEQTGKTDEMMILNAERLRHLDRLIASCADRSGPATPLNTENTAL